ncbi:hypothetical protein [Salinivibrio sp. IB643]|uniref:hypothetical protein n=1 Tax=Salinivibrio sp. IB643 TaxID=1909445 RepID=UPI0009890ED4|nr:hypothetical protein [Salinivibrio sp. IB643]OOE99652.1 hypothetical protein BZG77_02865 [Salinivibrio sp. IB643]
MSYQAALERALKALAAKGQSATVAKIKAQLDTQVPLPLIIQAVKSAKKNQPLPAMSAPEIPLSDAERIDQLEQHITQLSERLARLEATLDNQ